jgi:hypothetical protein
VQDLKKLLKLLRQNGILSYESNELKLTFSEEALLLKKEESPDLSPDEASRDKWGAVPDRILTNEELTYWSSHNPEDAGPEGDS